LQKPWVGTYWTAVRCIASSQSLAVADGIALDDAQALVEMSEGLDIVFDDGQVRVNGANLTDAIRTEEAGNSRFSRWRLCHR
jgi:cytidylate kinase